MPTRFDDFKPFHVLETFTGLGQCVVDRVFDTAGGRADQFDFLVGVMVSHGVLLRV
ncbi:hypothetical protein D3C87_1803160 [compost metagenome]